MIPRSAALHPHPHTDPPPHLPPPPSPPPLRTLALESNPSPDPDPDPDPDQERLLERNFGGRSLARLVQHAKSLSSLHEAELQEESRRAEEHAVIRHLQQGGEAGTAGHRSAGRQPASATLVLAAAVLAPPPVSYGAAGMAAPRQHARRPRPRRLEIVAGLQTGPELRSKARDFLASSDTLLARRGKAGPSPNPEPNPNRILTRTAALAPNSPPPSPNSRLHPHPKPHPCVPGVRKLSRLRRAKAWLNSNSSSSNNTTALAPVALAPVALAPVALVPVARRAYRRRARRRSRRRSRGHRRRRRRRRRQKRREEYSRSITTRLGSAHRQFNMQQFPMHDLPVFLVLYIYSTLDYNKNAPKGGCSCAWPYREVHTVRVAPRTVAARPRDTHPMSASPVARSSINMVRVDGGVETTK